MPAPKTIQIFLPDGEPTGLRTAHMTTRVVEVIDVPRKLLPDFREMPQSQQVGVYYLVGESDLGEPLVYVGQTGDLNGRLMSHNRGKDFWRRALVVVSRTNTLTQTHGLLLEWLSIAAARDAARYRDENGNVGTEPFTPPPLRAECEEFFETIGPLVATLGHPLFEPVVRRAAATLDDAIEPEPERRTYECLRGEVDGRGQYTSEGFVVLTGSSGPGSTKDYANAVERTRTELVEAGVAATSDGRFRFVRDHIFSSPSGASSVLVGAASNGWREWKLPDGRTLDEVERGGLEDGG